jgi:hypothetical protein
MTKEDLIIIYEERISLAKEKREVALKNNLEWGVNMADREIGEILSFINDLKKIDLPTTDLSFNKAIEYTILSFNKLDAIKYAIENAAKSSAISDLYTLIKEIVYKQGYGEEGRIKQSWIDKRLSEIFWGAYIK